MKSVLDQRLDDGGRHHRLPDGGLGSDARLQRLLEADLLDGQVVLHGLKFVPQRMDFPRLAEGETQVVGQRLDAERHLAGVVGLGDDRVERVQEEVRIDLLAKQLQFRVCVQSVEHAGVLPLLDDEVEREPAEHPQEPHRIGHADVLAVAFQKPFWIRDEDHHPYDRVHDHAQAACQSEEDRHELPRPVVPVENPPAERPGGARDDKPHHERNHHDAAGQCDREHSQCAGEPGSGGGYPPAGDLDWPEPRRAGGVPVLHECR